MKGMGRVAGSALAVALALALVAAARAADRPQDFEARKDEALRRLQTDAGKKYGDAFAKEFGTQYAPTLNACTQETGAPMGDDFDLLIKLGAKGQVEEVWVRPETKLAECFRKKVQTRSYPVPPSAGYWVLSGIKFTKASAP